jgi:putative acetyltransferase
MVVRRFQPSDASHVCEISYRSVHEVACARYSKAQLSAWAPKPPEPDRWIERLCEYDTFVADDDAGKPVGWIAMSGTGYIDMLFCLPEATKSGVAAELYSAVERVALERGIAKLTAHASHLAQSFFQKRGWVIEEHETIVRAGVDIPRAAMFKTLVVA